MEQPTPEEMEQAQAALKDFLHGMGAGGRTQRPADLPGEGWERAGGLPRDSAAAVLVRRGWHLCSWCCSGAEHGPMRYWAAARQDGVLRQPAALAASCTVQVGAGQGVKR